MVGEIPAEAELVRLGSEARRRGLGYLYLLHFIKLPFFAGLQPFIMMQYSTSFLQIKAPFSIYIQIPLLDKSPVCAYSYFMAKYRPFCRKK